MKLGFRYYVRVTPCVSCPRANSRAVPAEPRGVSEQREDNVQKHQAVFSLDYPSWQLFIRAFDIRSPLIPHRESEPTSVGSNGWYNG